MICVQMEITRNQDGVMLVRVTVSQEARIINVLKCRFYYYSGMARLRDRKTTAIEKVVCYTHRSHQEAEGERKMARAFVVVLMGEAGSIGLGLAPLDNFNGLWGMIGPSLVV